MAEETFATLHTNKGDIEIRLFADHAPKTVRNFVELAEGSREWKDPKTGAARTAERPNATTTRVSDMSTP